MSDTQKKLEETVSAMACIIYDKITSFSVSAEELLLYSQTMVNVINAYHAIKKDET